MEKKPRYLVVCMPERMSVEDIVEYQVSRLSARQIPYLVWCTGYLYEYAEEWSDKDPYIHYITMVNYAPLKEYKRYVILDQGKVSFSDTLKVTKGSAFPFLIVRAEQSHARTQNILKEIELKEKQGDKTRV